MRTRTVEIAGKSIVIREMKIKDIKTNLIPKIEPAWKAITSGEITDVIDNLGEQMAEIFPELKGVDIDECFPSEIEAFVEAWLDVNFFGIRRVVGPLLSLAKLAPPRQEQGAAGPSDSPNTGKN